MQNAEDDVFSESKVKKSHDNFAHDNFAAASESGSQATTNSRSAASRLSSGLIISIVLISLIVGALAGFGGAWLQLKHNVVPNLTNSQNLVVQEDSAVVSAVNKASPAVVSVVISQNVNQNQQSVNPFFFGQFFQPNSSQNNSTPTFQQVGAGSGFFISPDGLILTNKHVVADTQAKYTVYTTDGKKYDATVVARDPINDLALIKVDVKDAPTLSFADSSGIQIGSHVIAIGNSLGQYSNTVTSGIISGINRSVTAGGEGTSEQLDGVIQTDAAINPGNSGGPLLNLEGEVVGINTAIDQEGQLVGFAIPSNDAQKDIQSYKTNGKIIKGFLGVRYVIITPDIKDQYKLTVDNGAWVTSQVDGGSNDPAVVSGSSADKAGIKDGDIILSINGKQINIDNTLASIIKQYNPGDTLNADVLRNGKHISITVKLGQE